jgi:hypothetical protein
MRRAAIRRANGVFRGWKELHVVSLVGKNGEWLLWLCVSGWLSVLS